MTPRALDAVDLDRLRHWLRREAGIRAEDYRDEFLSRRVLPRMEAAGCERLAPYLELLERRPSEVKALVGRLLVPTTEFFRNADVFDTLGTLLLSLKAPRGLRLLSAPCSTGEEALTLAMLLETSGLRGKVVAADLCEASLARLASGRYPARALEKLDRATAARYFTEKEGWAEASPRLRARVLPVRWDLGRGMPGRGFHAVLLRNLFIYLTPRAQARMVGEAGEALVPGGLLVLGRVERLADAAGWEAVDRDARIYRWKGEGR